MTPSAHRQKEWDHRNWHSVLLMLISNVAGDRVTYRIAKANLREQIYMGLHAVGRGSERSPVLLALDYNPTGDKEAPVYAFC